MIKSNLSDDLITITQKLMMARERSEVLNLASEYTALIERAMQLEKQGSIATLQEQARSVTIIIKFTYKEIQMMSFTFKKEFIANGLAAHVIKKESGRNSYCYEIRYRSNGYNIIASSTDLAEAKRKFLAKTVPGEIEKYRVQKRKTGINLLEEVFDEWYQYKKGTITEGELKKHYSNFCALPETLRKKTILSVRTGDLDKILKDVKPRKYEDLRTLFNGIFKYAIASGIITHNPVALIPFKRAERQSRDALPEEEIYAFLERVELPEFEPIRQGAYLLYFFGLRPCEVDQETHKEDDFLIARNRKRKNGKIEYKKIPVPREAQGLIDWDKPLIFNCTRITRDRLFKKLLGDSDKTAYCLRHTFASICAQSFEKSKFSGKSQDFKTSELVEIWLGDSPERLVGKTYIHYSDNFMRKQMDIVEFPTLENRVK
jgi:integrase